MIVVDHSKLVEQLGSRTPVPVEVIPFSWQSTAKRLAALGSKPLLRIAADGTMFLTDGGNCILDCDFGPIPAVSTIQAQLDSTVGVVEHGLFVGLTSRVVVGDSGGVRLWKAVQGRSVVVENL